MANEPLSKSTIGEKVDNYLDSVPGSKRADAIKEIFQIIVELKTRIMEDQDMDQVNALLEKLLKLSTEKPEEMTDANGRLPLG